MTASPTNFSTTPPNDSISFRTVSWYGVRTARTSSGSSRSARAVKPTRSTKRTLMNRRSSCGGASSTASAAPHARQKRATSGLSWPQIAQTGTSEDYDEPQPTPQRHFGPVPVPGTGTRPEQSADLFAHQRRDGCDLAGEVGKLRRRDLLRAVAQRLLWPGMRLDDDPVCANRDGCPRQRQDELTLARRMGRIDDHRQVRLVLQHRHRTQV